MEEVEGEQHAGWMLGGERTTYTGLFYVRKHARIKLLRIIHNQFSTVIDFKMFKTSEGLY